MRRSLPYLTVLVAGLVAATVVVLVVVSVPVAGGIEPPVPTAPSVSIAAPTTTAPTTTTAPPTTTPPTTATTTDTATSLKPGASGDQVLALQRRLVDLGYWLGEPDGMYGSLTEQAVLAFQKVNGLERDGIAGPATRAAIARAGRPDGRSTAGDLVEVDKARQVLLVIRDGQVAWVLNASTGTERPYQVNGRTELADTPPGRWTVEWAVDGTDWGELGGLYRPRYFHRDGIAVHGYHDVPAWPASHGCVRVANEAMDWLWAANILPIGSTVWVY